MPHNPPRWRGILAVILACASLGAQASGFQVSPILLETTPKSSVATATLTNPSDTPVSVQVDGRAWSQDPGKGDVTVDTGELVIAPRIVTLAPRTQRPVRIALRSGGSRKAEQAFRVVFRELPPPPQPGFMGVRSLIAQDVPLFFTMPGDAQPSGWNAGIAADGTIHLRGRNAGRRYARFTSLVIVDTRGAIIARRDGPAYLLAGAENVWTLKTTARINRWDALRLRYTIDGKEQEAPLSLTIE